MPHKPKLNHEKTQNILAECSTYLSEALQTPENVPSKILKLISELNTAFHEVLDPPKGREYDELNPDEIYTLRVRLRANLHHTTTFHPNNPKLSQAYQDLEPEKPDQHDLLKAFKLVIQYNPFFQSYAISHPTPSFHHIEPALEKYITFLEKAPQLELGEYLAYLCTESTNNSKRQGKPVIDPETLQSNFLDLEFLIRPSLHEDVIGKEYKLTYENVSNIQESLPEKEDLILSNDLHGAVRLGIRYILSKLSEHQLNQMIQHLNVSSSDQLIQLLSNPYNLEHTIELLYQNINQNNQLFYIGLLIESFLRHVVALNTRVKIPKPKTNDQISEKNKPETTQPTTNIKSKKKTKNSLNPAKLENYRSLVQTHQIKFIDFVGLPSSKQHQPLATNIRAFNVKRICQHLGFSFHSRENTIQAAELVFETTFQQESDLLKTKIHSFIEEHNLNEQEFLNTNLENILGYPAEQIIRTLQRKPRRFRKIKKLRQEIWNIVTE